VGLTGGTTTSEVDELITDDSADEGALDALRRAGLKVTLV
jgi:hypothetical protein